MENALSKYAREPPSFWRVKGSYPSSFYYEFYRKCRSGKYKLLNVKSFIILRSEEGLTSFNKNNSVNLSGEKNVFRGVYFLRIQYRQKLKVKLHP